jgi:hypothetical protein
MAQQQHEHSIEILNVRQFLISILPFPSYVETTEYLFNEIHSQCFRNSRPFFQIMLNQQYDNNLLLFSERGNRDLIDYRILFMLQFHSENFKGNDINVITDVCTFQTERRKGYATQCLTYLLTNDHDYTLRFRNFPTILWIDQTTQYWQSAYNLYQRIGFRKFSDLENEFFKDYPGFDRRYMTFLKYNPITPAQQLRLSQTINYNYKLSLHSDALTDLFVSKYKFVTSEIEYFAISNNLNITRNKKHILIRYIETITQFPPNRPQNVVAICFSFNENSIKDFFRYLFQNRQDFTLLILPFHIIEIYWINTREPIDIGYIIETIYQFGISNINELTPLSAPNAETFALKRTSEVFIVDHTNRSGIKLTNQNPYPLPHSIRQAIGFHKPLSSSDKALVSIHEALSPKGLISSLSANPNLFIVPSATFLNIVNCPTLLYADQFNRLQQQQQRRQQQRRQRQRRQQQVVAVPQNMQVAQQNG